MKETVADIVRLTHFGLVLFMIVTPFIPNVHWTILSIHVTFAASLMFHWYLNEDACFLTLLECSLRGIPMRNSFMHSIVNPVYKIQDKELRTISHLVTPLLALISLYRIMLQWAKLRMELGIVLALLFQ